MQSNTTRRMLLASLAIGPATLAQISPVSAEVDIEFQGLMWLKDRDLGIETNLYRLTLGPNGTWSQSYPGPVSVLVESGTMSVPDVLTYKLELFGYGDDPKCPPNQVSLTEFGCATGFIAESGEFGTLANSGTLPLSLLVMFTSPLEP